jgi:hypothetical protein
MKPFLSPITPEQLAASPPDLRAIVRALIDNDEARIARDTIAGV